jgi:anhydro-N-acetylmuramic acid kinase
VRAVLKHPFFKKTPPKSTGRDQFPLELLLSKTRAKGADLVATATAVTVESIGQAYEKHVLKRGRALNTIYFCGGGTNNSTLMNWLQDRLPDVAIKLLSDVGFDGQMIEAQAFAFFGYLALMGSPIGGAWTGAKGFGPPAHIIPGENWSEVLSTLHEIRSQS